MTVNTAPEVLATSQGARTASSSETINQRWSNAMERLSFQRASVALQSWAPDENLPNQVVEQWSNAGTVMEEAERRTHVRTTCRTFMKVPPEEFYAQPLDDRADGEYLCKFAALGEVCPNLDTCGYNHDRRRFSYCLLYTSPSPRDRG